MKRLCYSCSGYIGECTHRRDVQSMEEITDVVFCRFRLACDVSHGADIDGKLFV